MDGYREMPKTQYVSLLRRDVTLCTAALKDAALL
jgi:hypothetical protein